MKQLWKEWGQLGHLEVCLSKLLELLCYFDLGESPRRRGSHPLLEKRSGERDGEQQRKKKAPLVAGPMCVENCFRYPKTV